MKFYLASSFELADQVQKFADVLKDEGHEITIEWWHHNYKLISIPDNAWYQDQEVRKVSKRNLKGIRDCDAFILFGLDKPKTLCGANIELGYALGIGKPCFAIGRLSRSAMYVPVKRYDNAFEFLHKEKLLKKRRKS